MPLSNGWGEKAILLHFSAKGDSLEFHEYGGALFDGFGKLYERPDGNFWISESRADWGNGRGPDTQHQAQLLLVNAHGDSIRSFDYTGTLGGSLFMAPGGSMYFPVYIIGNTDVMYDSYLVKTDANGNEQWRTKFGGPGYEQLTSVCSTPSGTLMVCGSRMRFSYSDSDILFAAVDTSGHILWEKTLDLHPERSAIYRAIPGTARPTFFISPDSTVPPRFAYVSDSVSTATSELPNGIFMEGNNVVITATVTQPDSPMVYLRMKFDQQGNEIERRFDRQIAATKVGKHAFASLETITTSGGKTHLVLKKTSDKGKLLWTRNLERPGFSQNGYLMVLPGGGFLIYGVANASNAVDTFQIFMIRTDRRGRVTH
jgi:hypothetical protein